MWMHYPEYLHHLYKVDIPFVGTVTCNPDAISSAQFDYHMSVENSVDWSEVHRADPEFT